MCEHARYRRRDGRTRTRARHRRASAGETARPRRSCGLRSTARLLSTRPGSAPDDDRTLAAHQGVEVARHTLREVDIAGDAIVAGLKQRYCANEASAYAMRIELSLVKPWNQTRKRVPSTRADGATMPLSPNPPPVPGTRIGRSANT